MGCVQKGVAGVRGKALALMRLPWVSAWVRLATAFLLLLTTTLQALAKGSTARLAWPSGKRPLGDDDRLPGLKLSAQGVRTAGLPPDQIRHAVSILAGTLLNESWRLTPVVEQIGSQLCAAWPLPSLLNG